MFSTELFWNWKPKLVQGFNFFFFFLHNIVSESAQCFAFGQYVKQTRRNQRELRSESIHLPIILMKLRLIFTKENYSSIFKLEYIKQVIVYIFQLISDCICFPVFKLRCFKPIYLIGKLRLNTNKKLIFSNVHQQIIPTTPDKWI